MGLIKTAEEIEKIKKACKVSAQVLSELGEKVKPGVTTAYLEEIAEKFILKMNARPAFKGYRGYKYATCLSTNDEVVHGLPGPRKLADGDIIGVDVGAIVDGYYGDNAETFAVGSVSKGVRKLLSATKEALSKGIAQARPGNHLGDVSAAIEAVAKKNGFGVIKDLYGHGVGSALHEDPLIPNYGKKGTGMELRQGMTLAIEPMFNIGGPDIRSLGDGWTIVTADGTLSAHFEHTILITDSSPLILTKRS
jgi:methionyl aminopeptidase